MTHPGMDEVRKRLAPELADALTALVRRLPESNARDVLTTADMFSGAFSDALGEAGSNAPDPDVMQGATALRWAVQVASQGDEQQARSWLSRVGQSLADNPLTAAQMAPEDLSPPQIAWVNDADGLHIGAVAALADHIKTAAMTGRQQVTRVYAPHNGVLVECRWRTDRTGATCSVIVALPDGRNITGLWSPNTLS